MQAAKHFRSKGKTLIASLLSVVVMLLGAMAACPALHELIHHDADQPGHECAATMFAHGKVDTSTVEISVVTPAAPIESIPQIVFSIFAPAIQNLPPGRAPPVFSAVS